MKVELLRQMGYDVFRQDVTTWRKLTPSQSERVVQTRYMATLRGADGEPIEVGSDFRTERSAWDACEAYERKRQKPPVQAVDQLDIFGERA